jgi:hypothetical protein
MLEEKSVLLALPRETMRALHRIVLMVQGQLDDQEPVISERQLKLIERQIRSALKAAADA